MKKITLILATIMLLASCTKHQYTINGVVDDPGMDGLWVYLKLAQDASTKNPIYDSVQIANGAFTLSGTIDNPDLYILITETDTNRGLYYYGNVILEPGKIYIDLVHDSLSGTPRNDSFYTNILRTKIAINGLYETYATEANEANGDPEILAALQTSITNQYNEYTQQLVKGLSIFYQENKDNNIGATTAMMLSEQDGMTLSELNNILGEIPPVLKANENFMKMYSRLQHIENTSAGHPFVDFEGIDFVTKESTTLGAMIEGHIAIVDFWASWCAPCRSEIKENLNRIYQQYQKKGLVVVGVDVWDEPEAHQKAVNDLGIKYKQLIDTRHASDTNCATAQYGINGIPTILLIDSKGTIIARDLRGDAIEAAVIEALKK